MKHKKITMDTVINALSLFGLIGFVVFIISFSILNALGLL